MPGNLYRYLDPVDQAITVTVNGTALEVSVDNGYVAIDREWDAGDTIRLSLPMRIRRIIAHPKATADEGRVAIERGPIIYCAEFEDNDFGVGKLKLPDSAELESTFEDGFFGGAVTITSNSDPRIKLIPYYLYSNRGKGWMRVWLPRH